MDLKTTPEKYRELLPKAPEDSHTKINLNEALETSAMLIRNSGIAHEFRSLTLPNIIIGGREKTYFGQEDRETLAPLADGSTWHIRPFVPGNCLDPAWNIPVN
jgi:hypothetical protein